MKARPTRPFLLPVLLAGLGLMLAGRAAAQTNIDTSHLKEMPDVDRIFADIRGTNALDTAARQWGAFYQLYRMVGDMSGSREVLNQLTPEEKRMSDAYFAAMGRTQPQFDRQDTNRAAMNASFEFVRLSRHYELDESLRKELFKRYFSPTWQAHYLAVKAARHAAAMKHTLDEAQRMVEEKRLAEQAEAKPGKQ